MARRRVKLYELNADRQWADRGTGHVMSSGMSLLVRAESDGSLLLESKIKPDTAYQKQQGTLIVWSEAENYDLALSFQERAGCDEVWERICQVQGKDPSIDSTQEVIEESEEERFDDSSDTNPWVELPSCELVKLEEINEVIGSCLHTPVRREKLALALENDGYVKKLISVFHTCEDLRNIEGLHLLFEIFKNIFLLNKNSLLEIMFADDMIFDVVGALEFDPSLPYPKKHRQYLKSIAKFKEVIPIENSELINKIHQTYRVQYIQDVVLPAPSLFEENMLSTLSSFIFFNKVEIVSLIQEDERFLTELFQQLSSAEDEISLEKRRDLVLFLKEFCTFSQTLQPQNRETYFKTLSSFGVLSALEITLGIDDQAIKSASIDILSYIVEFSPSIVREYMLLQQLKVEEESYLLNIIIEQMVLDTDPEMGGAVQLMHILRTLIDPENMMASVTKSEKTDFLTFFYKHSVHHLVAPLLSNTVEDEVGWEDYPTAQLLALILELLTFCVEHHTYHIKNYILSKNLLKRILVLMKSRHKFLVLSSLRFMRKILALRDDFYYRHIVNTNLFAPVVDAFVRNEGRYNLLDSAIIEMFEFIKLEDLKTLWLNIVEKFGSILSQVEYVQTFNVLKIKYEQHQDKMRDRDKNPTVDNLGMTRPSPGTRYRRDVRDMDADEEMWFNNDDDDLEESAHSVIPPREPSPVLNPDSPTLDKFEKETSPPPSNKLLLNPTAKPSGIVFTSGGKDNNNSSSLVVSLVSENCKSSSVVPCKKMSLVDYEENSDEEDEVSAEDDTAIDVSSTKRPRLSAE